MKNLALAALLGLSTTLSAGHVLAGPAVAAPLAQASAADEIAAGRRFLPTDPARALTHFERAHEMQGDFTSERWLVRGMIAVGRTNDALDRIQEMEERGADAALASYLFGYAFAGKAAQHVADGTGGFAAMNYNDAVGYFQAALEADADTYADAWAALADAAWWATQLDVARDAAEHAVAVEGSGPREQVQLGKVAFSQYSAAKQDESKADEAPAHWQTAFDAFSAAKSSLKKPTETADRLLLAEAALQRVYLLVWAERSDEARDDYVVAMTYNPVAVDFAAALNQLGEEEFLAALEAGTTGFTSVYGVDTESDATMLWWLGYARMQAKDYAGAEEAMLRAVEKWPAYANAWWTIATSRFSRQDYDGATEAVFHFQDVEPDGLVATIQSNQRMNLSLLDGLIGHYAKDYEATRDAGRALKAARLSLIQAAAVPDYSSYWNNAGLFYRDAGDYMKLKSDEQSQRLRAKYHEAAYENYAKALALEPENPIYLNDTALILHYCLDRDLERALEMYQEATRRAEEQLAREDLPDNQRPGIQTALRDSKNNARLLAKKIEKRKREKEREKEEPPVDEGGAD